MSKPHPTALRVRLIGLAIIIAAGAYGYWTISHRSGDDAWLAERAFRKHVSGVPVTLSGTVIRLLEDDAEGTPHQRFIIRTRLGQTLLIAHNLELAPRVPVEVADRVTVSGIYEWNDEGGIIHQTHHNPSLRSSRPGGWIRLERTGRTYQ